MTTEEYFEEWWTPKELPKNGFNKTAMLDFAEWYAQQRALRQPPVSSSFSSEYDHNCMMYLDKQRTCMVCGKQNCC